MLSFSDRGRGPVVVLLHGMGADRRRWDPVVELLHEDFRCLAVDLPGHGSSPALGLDVVSAAAAVQDVVVEAVGAAGATVVGHSFGATVALVHAALHRPRSVVAVDPTPLHLRHLAESLAPFVDRLRGDDFAAAFHEWEQRLHPDRVPGGLPLHPRQETVLAYWSGILDPVDAAARQAGYTAALHAIDVPALVCLAEPPSPEDDLVLRGMRTATVEVFDGLGHFLHLVEPALFCARLRRWHHEVGAARDGAAPP